MVRSGPTRSRRTPTREGWPGNRPASRRASSNRIPIVRSDTRAATARSATSARYAKSRWAEVAVSGNWSNTPSARAANSRNSRPCSRDISALSRSTRSIPSNPPRPPQPPPCRQQSAAAASTSTPFPPRPLCLSGVTEVLRGRCPGLRRRRPFASSNHSGLGRSRRASLLQPPPAPWRQLRPRPPPGTGRARSPDRTRNGPPESPGTRAHRDTPRRQRGHIHRALELLHDSITHPATDIGIETRRQQPQRTSAPGNEGIFLPSITQPTTDTRL